MKLALFALLFPVMSLAAPGLLDGQWKLSDRICSDGSHPSDSVDLKESEFIAEFSESNFKFTGHLNHCDFEADGFFKLQGKIITLYYLNNENCRGFGPKGAFSGALFASANEFSTVMTAKNAVGACRPGEALISTFTRLH